MRARVMAWSLGVVWLGAGCIVDQQPVADEDEDAGARSTDAMTLDGSRGPSTLDVHASTPPQDATAVDAAPPSSSEPGAAVWDAEPPEPPPTCEDGAVERRSCDPRGWSRRACAAGAWERWSACPDDAPTGCQGRALALVELRAQPLDVVTLQPPPCAAEEANGVVGTYQWLVVERPDGSTAQPVDRFFNPARPADGGPADVEATPDALFFVDLAGDFVLELWVEDLEGGPDVVKRVHIVAVPAADFHVQLVWHTPGDPDETDGEGTDIDLHLRHPRGHAWAVAPLDCYFANGEPDWGPLGPESNPTLDIDDVNGAGPENMNLDRPEDTLALGHPYCVGVHAFRLENFIAGGTWGPTDATVRVYLGGLLRFEEMVTLPLTDAFWQPACVEWSGGRGDVLPVGELTESIP